MRTNAPGAPGPRRSDPAGADRRHVAIRAGVLVEHAPVACPQGHRLGPSTCLVGTHPCLCAGRPHRTWRCRACDACWVWPACVERPEWVAWPGLDLA
jgi:hypothetical protein